MIYLVTGASSGLGLAVSQQLTKNGHFVIGLGRDWQKVNESSDDVELTKWHREIFDLRNTENIESLFQDLIARFGKLDGLIHCAGVEETLPITLYSPDKVKQLYEINVFAAHELLRVFFKKKNSNDNSSIVVLSSVMGVLGQFGKTGYCATKAALLGLVKASALEFSKRRIRVNAVLPGVVDTPMTQNLFSKLDKEGKDQIINMHPLGIGEPSDVAHLVGFLLSPDSKWITGQDLIIDGGYSIQ